MKLLILFITLFHLNFLYKATPTSTNSFLQAPVVPSFHASALSKTSNETSQTLSKPPNISLNESDSTSREETTSNNSSTNVPSTEQGNSTEITENNTVSSAEISSHNVNNTVSNETEVESEGNSTLENQGEPGEIEAHINQTYKPGQAFINRSSQEFIDPRGGKFETVEYVHELSPYAKEDIRDMNSPLKKDKALVGKPFYIENNITFDESPRIFHEIVETQISKVETPITPSSQYRLWKNWLGNRHFQDVSYSDSNRHPLTKPEEKKAEEIANPIVNVNPNHIVIPPKKIKREEERRIKKLANVRNPLKRQVYSLGYDNTFVKSNLEPYSELHDIADDVVQDIETYDVKKKKGRKY